MQLEGKNIFLRTVEEEDAEFIYSMRKDQNKTKYLTKVTGTIQDQVDWIQSYKIKEENKEEYYFVIESKEGEKLGLVRIYDLQEQSFCWGSWIIKDTAPITTGIESALQIYEFAFYHLGFKRSHFDVRKANHKVVTFHKKFGAKIIKEDALNYFFNITIQDYLLMRQKYKRYL